MNGPKYPIKADKIRIYQDIAQRDTNIKQYMHAEGTTLQAYIRQLSANEQNVADANYEASDHLFVINNRRGITRDMYIEWIRPGNPMQTFRIAGVDNFEYRAIELKIRATHVNAKSYDETRWKA